MTKLTIPNTDPDNPDDETVVEALELELPPAPEQPIPSVFREAILEAALDAERSNEVEETSEAARALIDASIETLAQQLKEHGLALGGGKLWAYKPRPKEAYNIWKRVVSMFIDMPASLDWSLMDLASRLNENQPNFTVDRSMFYKPFNDYAERDLARLLQKNGVSFTPHKPTTIATLRQQFIERRDMLQGKSEEHFNGEFEIRGNRLWINGRSYAIQHTPSGARRVRYGTHGWLNIEALKDFCSRG